MVYHFQSEWQLKNDFCKNIGCHDDKYFYYNFVGNTIDELWSIVLKSWQSRNKDTVISLLKERT